MPDDRVIDGMDMSDFFLGKTEKSGREGIIVYMGEEIFGVKWRNWKLNIKELENPCSETRVYEVPRLYNLLADPQECENVIFPHTWVARPVFALFSEHSASLKKEPPIKPGTLDPYQPAQ